MVNRSARNPGQLLRLEAEGRVSSNVPSAAVYTGQAFEALAGVAGGLSARLGKLADEAAAREGQMAGLSVGQQSGAAYLQAKASAAPANGPISAKGSNARAAAARDYLMKVHGLSEYHAAAIAGNGMQESGFNTTALGDKGTAFGAFQWRNERLAGLRRFAAANGKDINALETQLDYAMHELKTTEKTAGNAFFAAKDLSGAVDAFMGFERPAGWTPANPRGGHGYSNRLGYAQGLIGAKAATPPPQSKAPPEQPTELRPFGAGEKIVNEDGTISTERTETYQLPDGKWINVPSLWMSPKGPVDLAGDENAIMAALSDYEARSGKEFPRFSDLSSAETAARARSEKGGAQAGTNTKERSSAYSVETLSTQPLALRRDGTIRGQAFDDAAAGAYAWRMQEGLSNELFAAHQQFADQPEEFAAAVSDIRAKYGADPNLADPVLREAFDKSFTQKSEAYARDVAAKHETRMRQEQLVSFSDGLTAAQLDIERQAQVLGANPQGDAIIADQVTKLGASIDGAVESGTITPAQAAKLKDELALTAARGRIQGVFEALPTPERKEQYSLAILDDWKAGKGPLAKLPYATVKAMSDTMRRDAREEINLKIAANKTEAIKLSRLADDDIASMQATGKGLDPSSGLTPERVLELTGEQGLAEWQAAREKAGRIYDATSGMEKQSAGDIAERLAMIRPKPGEPGYAEELEIYGLAEKQAREILKERETDPLGQAARGGAIELAAIDATSAESLQQSLSSRREAQATVAGLYGQAVPFFRPGEKEALSSALATNPEALSGFAFAVRDVFGKDTPKVLAEIAPEAPIIAHAAGLALATGDNSVAADVANTLAMKREKVFTAKMPSEAELSTRASMELGGALSANPRTQGALVQTANVLFEHMANTQGFNAADIKTEGSAAQTAYGRALERAAGGRTIGGVAYGGLAEVNGQTIIVPSDMPKDAPQKLMENLTQEQLDFLPPIDAGDYMLDIGDIRRATLIADGDGLYRVALGDPLSDDPRYLATPDGRYWRLDIRALQQIAGTMPGRAGSFGDQNLNPFGWQAPR